MNKKIEEFIQATGEGIVLDYVNGQFVLENKSFVEGKSSVAGRIQGLGSTIDICIDNFLYSWEKKIIFERSHLNDDDIESYRWYASH